jgi:uncharacterized protein with PQ loop repeat
MVTFSVMCWLFSGYLKVNYSDINIWHIIDFIFAPIVLPYVFSRALFKVAKNKVNG